MQLLSSSDFFTETSNGRFSKMKTEIYDGKPFQCACGKTHFFYTGDVGVVREVFFMKLVVECPDQPNFLSCIKIKGLFRYKFESLLGTKIEDGTDVLNVYYQMDH